MPFKKPVVSTVTFAAIIFTHSLQADDQDVSQLMDMDLGQLLNVSITVASKKEESLLDTPSSVTVFRDSEINQYGYYTLRELAEVTPGYSVIRNFPQTRLETRGGLNSNLKHLVLIDGIPVNSSYDYAASLDYLLPVHWASQVEFLRGPASALYGISAFNGVLNIRDDHAIKDGASSSNKLTLGSDDRLFRYLGKHTFKNESGETRLSFSQFKKDNSNRPVTGPLQILPDTSDLGLKDSENSYFIYLNHKGTAGPLEGFTLGLLSFRRESGGDAALIRPFNETNDLNRDIRSQFIPYIKYETTVDDWQLQSYYKFDYSKLFFSQFNEGDIPSAGIPLPLPNDPNFITPVGTIISERNQFARTVTTGHKVAFEANYETEEFGHFIAGLDIAKASATPNKADQSFLGLLDVPPVPSVLPTGLQVEVPIFPTGPVIEEDENTLSLYTQYTKDFDHLDKLRLTVGVRVDTAKINGFVDYSETSPRIALIQRFADNWSIKGMYGFALRAPSLLEVNQNNILLSDPNTDPALIAQVIDLTPETIDVYEAVLQYSNDHFFASLTYFNNSVENAITAIFVPQENGLYYINEDGTAKADGIEAEVKFEGDNYQLAMHYSTRDTKQENGTEVTGVPDQQFALLGSYVFDVTYPTTVSLAVKHYGSLNPVIPTNDKNDGYTITDVKISSQLSNRHSVELKLSNVFDEGVFVYESNPFLGTESAYANFSEFEALLSLNYNF